MNGSRFTFHASRLLLLAALLSLLASVALAQSGGGYDLSWSTMEGGGYTWSEGGGYSLGGTVGQPGAGTLSGEGYILAGGFWSGAVVRYGIYLPLILRNYP
jgi:hypothetical protein